MRNHRIAVIAGDGIGLEVIPVAEAVVEAINAGVDLLLVAYDGAQFYRVFACALEGSRKGMLDAAMLRASEARLAGFSIEQARAASGVIRIVDKH